MAKLPALVNHAIASIRGKPIKMVNIFRQQMAVMNVNVIKVESLVRFEPVPLFVKVIVIVTKIISASLIWASVEGMANVRKNLANVNIYIVQCVAVTAITITMNVLLL
jgi:hypothetical protein